MKLLTFITLSILLIGLLQKSDAKSFKLQAQDTEVPDSDASCAELKCEDGCTLDGSQSCCCAVIIKNEEDSDFASGNTTKNGGCKVEDNDDVDDGIYVSSEEYQCEFYTIECVNQNNVSECSVLLGRDSEDFESTEGPENVCPEDDPECSNDNDDQTTLSTDDQPEDGLVTEDDSEKFMKKLLKIKRSPNNQPQIFVSDDSEVSCDLQCEEGCSQGSPKSCCCLITQFFEHGGKFSLKGNKTKSGGCQIYDTTFVAAGTNTCDLYSSDCVFEKKFVNCTVSDAPFEDPENPDGPDCPEDDPECSDDDDDQTTQTADNQSYNDKDRDNKSLLKKLRRFKRSLESETPNDCQIKDGCDSDGVEAEECLCTVNGKFAGNEFIAKGKQTTSGGCNVAPGRSITSGTYRNSTEKAGACDSWMPDCTFAENCVVPATCDQCFVLLGWGDDDVDRTPSPPVQGDDSDGPGEDDDGQENEPKDL